MRPSTVYLTVAGVLTAALVVFCGAGNPGGSEQSDPAGRTAPVRIETACLGLTDPCLFVDDRSMRHRSLADFHAPFQHFPGAMDMFPSGGFSAPQARPGGSGNHGSN